MYTVHSLIKRTFVNDRYVLTTLSLTYSTVLSDLMLWNTYATKN